MGSAIRTAVAMLVAAGLAPLVTPAAAAAGDCRSSNPADWPSPSKPYFLVIADTSGTMSANVGLPAQASSCGLGTTQSAHLRCALRGTFAAYSGQVSFGLATFPRLQTGCVGCSCAYSSVTGDNPRNLSGPGCGPGAVATARGALIRVPIQQDSFWTTPSAPNTADLLGWVDGSCGGNAELYADGATPINGALRDAKRYLGASWTDPTGSPTFTTPLASQDLAGTGVNGATACRSVNVILIVDGDESCDTQADALAAAQDLYQNGVTVGGKTFKVRVHVVNLIGATLTATDLIAAVGGSGTSYWVHNETELAQALANIVGGSINAETCNNKDDDCNGCVDEGFAHYANVRNLAGCCPWSTPAQRTTCGVSACPCCSGATPAQRNTCLSNYTATITGANPHGDLTLLPCTTTAQAQMSATWLCYDPGDVCDGIDNNGDDPDHPVVDEGSIKCGFPLHCPTTEVCNGLDDDCDGEVDEGNVCAATCAVAPSAEVCNGCDDDCDGLTDNGLAVSIPCGFAPGPTTPAYCAGTLTCKPPQAVPKGTCAPGGGFTTCQFPPPGPMTEVCDGMDNDCNGVVDDSIPSQECVPMGTPGGLVYNDAAHPNARCHKGTSQCVNGATQCVGFVGPQVVEVCNGVDDDCDGVVDDGIAGLGQPCGVDVGACTHGSTACVNGALTCQGAVLPQPEICDGIDNDCDGLVDEEPLADGPSPGENGCWELPGSCCVFGGVAWCPPVGGDCHGLGTLSGPCRPATLSCSGGQWICSGSREPQPELCNGVDDDCDGVADGAVVGAGAACGTAEGECTAGVLVCTEAGIRCTGAGPTAELCDGKDNDCNGVIDDGIDCGAGDACSRVTCPAGARCESRGGGAVCLKTESETVKTSGGCGTTGAAGAPALLLAGLLWLGRRRAGRAGTRRAAPAAIALALAAATLGLAACGGGGSTSERTKESEVAPTAAAGCTPTNGGVERCDGLDDDCNGVVDDVTVAGEPSLGTACQGAPHGICADPAHAGTVACRGGRLVCVGAAVLHAHEVPETCNGVDDDCDGSVDNNPVDAGTACGTTDVPPCAKGTTQCQAGSLVCVGAIEPGVETCNGIDDDCNGVVDDGLPASQSGGACDVPPAPPPGATSACRAGIFACVGGVVQCVGSLPAAQAAASDACGVDANCDGQLTNQPDTATDVHDCGACGNDCLAGAVHASWACVSGTCTFQGCQPGYWDNGGPGDAVAGDHKCGYACSFVSAQELCNGADDDCDGQIDEGVVAPPPSRQCGVSPAATAPECSPYDPVMNPAGVTVACVAGAWQCTFHTARVCDPSCATATEVCETTGRALDNDCDGLVNENTPNYGQPCASDDGLPAPGHGACRATGVRICATESTTTCGAVKDLAKAGPEVCDGVDNDCDGLVDEPFTAPGSNPSFVKPVVTQIRTSPALWIYSYEASRPSATGVLAGTGNGYHSIGGVDSAPVGVPLDKTSACSIAGKLPWYDVTAREVEQTCAAMGGRICTTAEWQLACAATAVCAWGYAPRDASCTTAYTGTKYCNLGPSYDFAPATPGDQDGLLPTASVNLRSCWADWSGQPGNVTATSKIFDITGNLREVTKGAQAGTYSLMGGSYVTQTELGASCTFTGDVTDTFTAAKYAGFRCCFDANPSPP